MVSTAVQIAGRNWMNCFRESWPDIRRTLHAAYGVNTPKRATGGRCLASELASRGIVPIGTVNTGAYPVVMNTIFRTEKILLAVVGIASIATLSLSARVMSQNSSRAQAVSPNHKSSDMAGNTTNSPSVNPHYRLPGNNGPVWPPSLPVHPLTPRISS